MTAQKMQIRHNIFHLKLLLSWNSTYVTKKRVWQVTTIIQLALCHLVTSHFQEIACNYTPKGQIRWPIFLLLLCMIVLTEITSKFPKPIIFRILVFSCHKMTLITKITWMPHSHCLCDLKYFPEISFWISDCHWPSLCGPNQICFALLTRRRKPFNKLLKVLATHEAPIQRFLSASLPDSKERSV